MQAAIAYEAQGQAIVEEVDLNKPGVNEVLVRLHASGVCHSDWHILKGDWGDRGFPLILGHEGAGVVEAVGDGVSTPKVGDHVILSWRTNCGMCEMCQKGWPVLCDRSPGVATKPMLHGTEKQLASRVASAPSPSTRSCTRTRRSSSTATSPSRRRRWSAAASRPVSARRSTRRR